MASLKTSQDIWKYIFTKSFILKPNLSESIISIVQWLLRMTNIKMSLNQASKHSFFSHTLAQF